MKVTENKLEVNFNEIPVSDYWSVDTGNELAMHRIHAYPAKFPYFIVSKSIEYAKSKKIGVSHISDVFCGCGTTALEARRGNLDFSGYDINPVATLIAKVKSEQYQENLLKKYHERISHLYSTEIIDNPESFIRNERIKYWFRDNSIEDLYKILSSIRNAVPEGKYRNFFLCAFSSILKKTSRWLAKSIKPQIDPDKSYIDAKEAFDKQCEFMFKANTESKSTFQSTSKSRIFTRNFLNVKVNRPIMDIVITSPPYVTSYEYADLHQLTALWLGYTADYRDLRKGSIGSVYNTSVPEQDLQMINEIGLGIYNALLTVDKAKAKSVIKYFNDIRESVCQIYNIIKPGGLTCLVIGNTNYKGINIDNTKYLAKCLIDRGFSNTEVYRRKIGSKNLTPYRDEIGRFTKDKNSRVVYSHEFVLIARK